MKQHSSISFLQKIIQHAFTIPNSIAVTSKNVNYTYKELLDTAASIATLIKNQDTAPQEVIAIFMPSGYDLITAQLGVLINKQIFVTIDPMTPKHRVETILSDLSVKLLITNGNTSFDKKINTLRIDDIEIEDAKLENLVTINFDDDSSVYIIATSGSTGKPKNVEIPYSALDNFCIWQVNYYNLHQNVNVSSIASGSFDASISEIWPALMVGARIMFPDADKKMLPSYLIKWISNSKIQHCFIPTPLAEVMLRLEWPKSCQLKTMVVAGDKMYGFPTEEIPFKVYNNYGPSEYTVCATGGEVVAAQKDLYDTPTIGKPIRNTEVYILNDSLKKVANGEIGELFISGKGLAKGYYNDEALTKEKFVHNPFDTSLASIMYKTGDLGTWTKDGNIIFCGRLDNQIKIKGNRVEIEEVTVNLRKHSAIKEAYTKVFYEDSLKKKTPYLVAYFSPKNYLQAPGEQDIYEYLETRLPSYMLPSKLVLIHDFALNRNGKIDATQLPNPEISELGNRTIDPPTTSLEKEIVTIWCDILKIKNIGIHEDFFHLGGNSLAAIHILEQIRSVYRKEILIKHFWKHATIHQLAKLIETCDSTSGISIIQVEKGKNVPLSVQQEQVWFLQKYAPNSNAYNAQTSLRINGSIKISVLEQALQEIFNRHELLRTTYEEEDGKPKQIVHANFNFSINYIDLRECATTEIVNKKEAVRNHEFAHVFDLTQLPLCKFTLIQIEDELFELLLVEHHMVHDGVSYSILMNELHVLYNDLLNENSISLTPLSIQYSDYSVWQREMIRLGEMNTHVHYWKNKLKNASKLIPLPLDYKRPKIQNFEGDQLRFDLSLSLSKKIKRFSKDHRITMFSTMFTAFALLLHKYTLEEDMNIGSAVANRQPHDTEGLIGMFVNAIVIRCLIDKKSSFLEISRYLQDEVMEGNTHQLCPFPHIVKELNVERDLSYNPIFQTMFSFHDAAVVEPMLGNAKCTIYEEGNSSAKQDIDVVVIPKSGRYQGNSRFTDNRINIIWEYNKGLFDRGSMERMANNYQFFLENLLDHIDVAIEKIASVSTTELTLLRTNFGTLDKTEKLETNIENFHEVLNVLQSNGASIAVYSKHGITTYDTLYDQVMLIILYLSKLNLEENDTIGLHLDKGAYMISSQIACLILGVAFVPITPEIPLERKKYIIDDANCRIVITESQIDFKTISNNNCNIITILSLLSANNYTAINDISLLDTTPKSLAYILYTSGSTGKPKGVMIPRKALLNYINWHIKEFDITSNDRSTLLYSSGFDASLAEIWPSIVSGSSIYSVSKEILLNPISLQKFILKNKITICDVPTPLAERLLLLKWPSKSDLRVMLTGGQKLTIRPPKGVDWKLYNQYGPTETTITATSSQILPDNDNAMLPSIGRPIRNTTFYVLDDALHRTPMGGVGELFIGGDGLAIGYLGDEIATKNNFIHNPFTDNKEDKIYKTGDMVRILTTGELYFMGRRDTQVKIRGFRIELEEITKNTQEIEGVKKAYTTIYDETIVCYYIRDEKVTNINNTIIKSTLKKKLPNYMIPTHIMELEEILVTASGKIDEKNLPTPAFKIEENKTAIAVSNDIEEHLVTIWSSVLGHTNFSITDNFFDLGGHSLKIVEVQSLLLDKTGVELPLMAFFEYSTITEISNHINGNSLKTKTVSKSNNKASLRKKALNRRG